MKQFSAMLFLLGLYTAAYPQANNTLSNLSSPTAVNQHLNPKTTNTYDLGTSTLAWRNQYLRGYVYLDGTVFLSNQPGTGAANAFIGSNAGKTVTTGQYNSAMGHYALFKDTSGSYNTANGAYALYNNTNGNYNVAIGPYALYTNSSASNNTAIGYLALNANSTGTGNVAVGSKSMHVNTVGFYNTAVGSSSLASNTTGGANTAVGGGALSLSTTGNVNTAIGSNALFANKTGYGNTGLGNGALYSNTTGYQNTATGREALNKNQTGVFNTALGCYALLENKASNNTAVGYEALRQTQYAQNNTAVGFRAGYLFENGYNNVFLGAGANVNAPGYFNVIVIGQGTTGTASNQVTIGNAATRSYRAYSFWSNISDGRFKKGLKEDVPGLAFIKKLRPVTYTLDASGLEAFLNGIQSKEQQVPEAARAAKEKAIKEKEELVQTGFVAQEVEQAALAVGYDFNGVDKPKNQDDVYGLNYEAFVVPLVKAVQELDSLNRAREERITSLESQVSDLRRMVAELKSGSTGAGIATAYLEQNTPNPAGSITTIRYFLPESATSPQINITDAAGHLVKKIAINGWGNGYTNLDTTRFPSGMYNYTLYVNGRKADSKRFVITR